MVEDFKFELGQLVRLARSQEEGEIIGRAEYVNMEPHYYVRYVAGDGRLCETWWGESALAEG